MVTKNYPDDTVSDLDAVGRWRLNIHVGRSAFTELTGEDPRAATAVQDFTAVDTVLPHPVYRRQGWIAITNPGSETLTKAIQLLQQAHDDAKRRAERSQGKQHTSGTDPSGQQ